MVIERFWFAMLLTKCIVNIFHLYKQVLKTEIFHARWAISLYSVLLQCMVIGMKIKSELERPYIDGPYARDPMI